MPITEYETPIEWAFTIGKNNFLRPIKKNAYKIRSQDLRKKYHDVGYFAGIPAKFFLKKNIQFDQNYIGYKIERRRAIDIDNYNDWKIAEAMYKTI